MPDPSAPHINGPQVLERWLARISQAQDTQLDDAPARLPAEYRRLALAVILRALADIANTHNVGLSTQWKPRMRQAALDWIAEDGDTLHIWCTLAGVTPSALQTYVHSASQEDTAHAAV